MRDESNHLWAARLAATPPDGPAWSPNLRNALSERLRTSFSDVVLRASAPVDDVLEALGARAVASGRTVWLRRDVADLETTAGVSVLIHELVHVGQQARARQLAEGRGERGDRFEQEAEAAVPAVLRGAEVTIASSFGCPTFQCDEEDVAFYERGYGFASLVPFVGSGSQLISGKTTTDKVLGGVFLVLDCTLVGGLLVKGGRALLKGGAAGLRLATRGATKAAVVTTSTTTRFVQRGVAESGKRLANEALERGVTIVARPEVAQAMVQKMARQWGSEWVVIAAEKGALHHSQVFLVHVATGKTVKVHGSILRRVYRSALTPRSGGIPAALAKANSYSLYPAALTTEQILAQLSRVATKPGFSLGCAWRQALTLNQFTAQSVRTGSNLFPLALTGSRLAGPGAHVLLSPGRMLYGSATHFLAYTTGKAVLNTPTMLQSLERSYDQTAMAPGLSRFDLAAADGFPPDGAPGLIFEERDIDPFQDSMEPLLDPLEFGGSSTLQVQAR